MRKSCAAKADSCDGSANLPVTRCMVGAISRSGLGQAAAAGTGASIGLLGLAAAAGTGASRSGSSLRWG